MKNMSEISYNKLLPSSQEISSMLEKTVYEELGKKHTPEHKSNIQVPSKFMEH